MAQQGFFNRPFGQTAQKAGAEAFQKEWEELAGRIQAPVGGRPDHSRLCFLQLTSELDTFLRKWSSLPETRSLVGTAHQSLSQLLAEARSLFEARERGGVEQQRMADQRRWESAQEQKRQAEHQSRLRQTELEIQAIYEGIRTNQRVAQERQHANWMAAHFPDTTCACGRAKVPNHLFCWDCAPGRRSAW